MFSLCFISDFNLTVDVEIRVTGCLFLFETFTFPNFSDLTREGCVIWLHVIDSAGNISNCHQMFTQISLCPDWCTEWYHIILCKWAKPSSTREKSQIQKSLNNQNCSKLRRRSRGLKRKGFFWATKVPASSISWGWVNTFTAPYLVWQPIKSGRASPKKILTESESRPEKHT